MVLITIAICCGGPLVQCYMLLSCINKSSHAAGWTIYEEEIITVKLLDDINGLVQFGAFADTIRAIF